VESDEAEPGVVVLQYGAHWCRAGFACDLNAPCALRSTIFRCGCTFQLGVPQNFQEIIICIDEAHSQALPWYLRSKRQQTVQAGSVNNWDDFGRILDHIFRKELRLAPENHPVLVVEPPLCTQADRHRLCVTLFDDLSVPAVAFASAASLTLQTFGLNTGVVLDCGSSCATATAVHMSQPVPGAAQRLLLGEDDMMHHILCAADARKGNVRSSTYDKQVRNSRSTACIRNFKDTFCFVSSSSEPPAATEAASITLPFDDSATDVTDACWLCPELLFRPSFESPVAQTAAEPLSIQDLELLLQQLPETQLRHFCIAAGVEGADSCTAKSSLVQQIHQWLAVGSVRERRGADLQAMFDAYMQQRRGVADMVHACIQACEAHLRPQLYGNVVICGGNSMFPGFKHRLMREIQSLAPDSRVRVSEHPLPTDLRHTIQPTVK
jgi:actin-related protein